MSSWNGNRFSVYTSEEKSVLGLIKEMGDQTNYNSDEIVRLTNSDNKKVSHQEMEEIYKINKQANFTGSWFGIKRPTASNEGLAGTVNQLIDEVIPNLNIIINDLINKNNISFYNLENMQRLEGEEDDTKRIQRALDYCIENNLTLLIPNKTYTVSQQGKVILNFGGSVRGYCIYAENKEINIIQHGVIKVNLGDGIISDRPNVFLFKKCSGVFTGGIFRSIDNISKILYGGYPILLEQCNNFKVYNISSYDMNGGVVGTTSINCEINNCYSYNTLKDMSKSGAHFGFYASNLCDINYCKCFGGTGDGDISLYGVGNRNRVINCRTYNSLSDLIINTSSNTAQGICVDAGQNNCVVSGCYAYGYYYGYDIKTNIEGCDVYNNIAEKCKVSFTLRYGEAQGNNAYAKFSNNTVLNPSNGNSNVLGPYNAIWVGFYIENTGCFDIESNVIKTNVTYSMNDYGIGIKIIGNYNSNGAYIKPINIKNNTFFDEIGLGSNVKPLNMCDIYIDLTYPISNIIISSNNFTGGYGSKTSTPFIDINKARTIKLSNNNFGRHDSTSLPCIKAKDCNLTLEGNVFDYHKHSILTVENVNFLKLVINDLSYNESYINQITGSVTNSAILIGNTLTGGSNTGFLTNFTSGKNLKAIGNVCIGRGVTDTHFVMTGGTIEKSCNIFE